MHWLTRALAVVGPRSQPSDDQANGQASANGDHQEPSTLDNLLSRGRTRALLSMLGPAFVASIAYVDPGNFATNFQAGARFGYLLLWVVLGANLIAMLVQYLSAKLGVVTGQNLAENFRQHYPRSMTWMMWLQAEIMAMSTDVAEFLGAAIGLKLIFHVPLFPAGIITGLIAILILGLQQRGHRPFEIAITGLLGIIVLGFLYEALKIGPSASASLNGLVPRLRGAQSIYLAVGIMGATIMPHAIYLHGALTQDRTSVQNDHERRRVLRFIRADVVIALTIAGLTNMAMLAIAAKLLHRPILSHVTGLIQVHQHLEHLAGGGAALAFAVALLASGASSSSVGTYAGQVVMAGFVKLRIPLLIRRLMTMTPALIIIALKINPTQALVFSQVILSFGIPLALIPLVRLTSRKDVMHNFISHPLLRLAAWSCTTVIVVMNLLLIYQQFRS